MKKLTVLSIVTVLIIPLVISCAQVASDQEAINPALVDQLTSIPAEYGQLVDVTNTEMYPEWFQMWFQDDEGTIRVVRIQLFDNLIHRDVKVYPRSQPEVAEVEDDG